MTLKPLKEFSSLFELFSSLIAAKAVSSIYKIAPEDCASRLLQWLTYPATTPPSAINSTPVE